MPCSFTASTLEYALAQHRAARRHAEAADTAASLAAFYSSDLHHLSPADAGKRAASYRIKASLEANLESIALRHLNRTLHSAGAEAGEEVEVGLAVYRAYRDGVGAVYLGAVPPLDMEDDDDADEVAEMMSSYRDATRTTA